MASVNIEFSDKYTSKKDNKIPVRIIVRLSNREKKEISTSVRILKPEWDEKSLRVNKKNKNHNDLNLIIENKLSQINSILTEYRLMRKKITLQQFRDELKTPSKRENFIQFYDVEINERSAMKIINDKAKKQYKSHLNKLKEFKKEISFSEVDEKFINSFHKYLVAKGYKRGTIHNALKTLRIFVNLAYRRKLIDDNPFRGYKMPGQDSATIFLVKEEVVKLFDLYKSKDLMFFTEGGREVLKYQKTLQAFLFITQTGLRISEMLDLKVSDVIKIKGRNYIILTTRKTEEENIIPLTKKAYSLIKEILKIKLKGLIFFGFPPESKMNKFIKEIAQKAGIDKEKSQKLTFHKGRHTFATLAITEYDADIKTVSSLLGHKRASTTLNVYTHLVKGNKESVIDAFDKD